MDTIIDNLNHYLAQAITKIDTLALPDDFPETIPAAQGRNCQMAKQVLQELNAGGRASKKSMLVLVQQILKEPFNHNGPFLVFKNDNGYGDVVPLQAEERYTLGRANTNRIVVRDEFCSRVHAEVFFAEGHWFLHDLKSLNRTRLNGIPVDQDYELSSGDAVQLGDSELIFVHPIEESSGHLKPQQNPAENEAGTVAKKDSDVLVEQIQKEPFNPRRSREEQEKRYLEAKEANERLRNQEAKEQAALTPAPKPATTRLISCPHCHGLGPITDEMVGKWVQCSGCEKRFLVVLDVPLTQGSSHSAGGRGR